MVTTTARGLLMLSPRLMPTTDTTMDMDLPTMVTMVTLTLTTTVTTTARGLLMLSPRLMPTTDTTMDMLLTDMPTVVTMATPTLTVLTTATDIITNYFIVILLKN